MATRNGKAFANQLNDEYRKLKTSKSQALKRLKKLPVRVYGSGDFIPEHYTFLKKLDFKFFVISKSLTYLGIEYIKEVADINNLTSVLLSFDNTNLKNYNNNYLVNNKVKTCFTGMPDEFTKLSGFKFNAFFNISKKHVEQAKAEKIAEACPCDSGKMKLQQSCSYCNKCWK